MSIISAHVSISADSDEKIKEDCVCSNVVIMMFPNVVLWMVV